VVVEGRTATTIGVCHMIRSGARHDSDYGKQAATSETLGGGDQDYVFDDTGKFIKECDDGQKRGRFP